jgi:hypothetical protein
VDALELLLDVSSFKFNNNEFNKNEIVITLEEGDSYATTFRQWFLDSYDTDGMRHVKKRVMRNITLFHKGNTHGKWCAIILDNAQIIDISTSMDLDWLSLEKPKMKCILMFDHLNIDYNSTATLIKLRKNKIRNIIDHL